MQGAAVITKNIQNPCYCGQDSRGQETPSVTTEKQLLKNQLFGWFFCMQISVDIFTPS